MQLSHVPLPPFPVLLFYHFLPEYSRDFGFFRGFSEAAHKCGAKRSHLWYRRLRRSRRAFQLYNSRAFCGLLYHKCGAKRSYYFLKKVCRVPGSLRLSLHCGPIPRRGCRELPSVIFKRFGKCDEIRKLVNIETLKNTDLFDFTIAFSPALCYTDYRVLSLII
jgi:hypothetical protein